MFHVKLYSFVFAVLLAIAPHSAVLAQSEWSGPLGTVTIVSDSSSQGDRHAVFSLPALELPARAFPFFERTLSTPIPLPPTAILDVGIENNSLYTMVEVGWAHGDTLVLADYAKPNYITSPWSWDMNNVFFYGRSFRFEVDSLIHLNAPSDPPTEVDRVLLVVSWASRSVPPSRVHVDNLRIGPDGAQVLFDGFGDPVNDTIAGVEDQPSVIPSEFSLSQNYPNPFNPETTLRFRIEGSSPQKVTLKIYNVLGQELLTLVNGVRSAGTHAVTWNGRDAQGRQLASGIYLARLQAGGNLSQVRRMVLSK